MAIRWLVSANDIGLSNHNGLPRLRCNLFLAERGAIAFFIYTLIFHYMPRTMKNASTANNSSHASTLNSAKTVSYEKFEIEMNAKNKAYYFILSHNLLNEFAEFCKTFHSNDPLEDCLEILLSKK